ncbi:MAG: hypothetical protein J1E63_01045 [Muribaculaceae bacterium]|nr:hypothetical protein [Muribaculaceae bacterium]
MKLNKIYAIGLAALTLTACSDNDSHDINTAAGVTVHMEETEVSATENVGLFNVPVVIEGNANGFVEVDVKIVEGTTYTDEEEPAITDAHFYVTSTHIYINPETKVANIEVRPVDFRLPQKTRSFSVVIDKVNGATVSGNASTTVYILDKGTSPQYAELLTGQWLVNFESALDGSAYAGRCNVQQDAELGGMNFNITGFDYDGLTGQIPLVYEWDDEIGYGDVAIRMGGLFVPSPVSFTGYGPCYMRLTDGSATSGSVAGLWNNTYSSVSFGDLELYVMVYQVESGSQIGYYDVVTNITLTHVK